MDNRGNHLSAIDESPINIPGIGAAVVTKPYVAQGLDELSLDIGNMISLIDMPPKEESAWWRGKKEFQANEINNYWRFAIDLHFIYRF